MHQSNAPIFDFSTEPIVKAVKGLPGAVQNVAIVDDRIGLLVAGEWWLVSLHSAPAPEKADHDTARAFSDSVRRARSEFSATPSIEHDPNGYRAELVIRRKRAIRPRYACACGPQPIREDEAMSAHFFYGNELLFWALPDRVMVFDARLRGDNNPLFLLSLRSLQPTAITASPGVIVVGRATGEALILNFQPASVQFILGLDADETPDKPEAP